MGYDKIRRPLLAMKGLNAKSASTCSTSLTVSAGNLTATAGNLVATAGNIVATAGNFVATAGGFDAAVQTSTALLGKGHCLLTGSSSTAYHNYSLAAPTPGMAVSLCCQTATDYTAVVTLAAGCSFYTTSTAATTRTATFTNSAQCLLLMGASTTKYHVLSNIGTVALGTT